MTAPKVRKNIAKQNIYIGTALGYAPGDEVSDEVVEAYGLQDAVDVIKLDPADVPTNDTPSA